MTPTASTSTPRSLMPAGAIVASAVLWGAWWMPLRALEARGLSGSWATAAVYAVAFVLLVPLVARGGGSLVAGRRDLALIALFSGTSLAAWNHAIIVGEVVRAMLLFFLCPVWATLITRFVLRQPLAPLRVVSIPLGLAGAAIVLGVDSDIPIPRTAGDALALFAGVLFAIATVVVRRAEALGDWAKTAATFAGCTLGALAIALAFPAGVAPSGSTVLGLMPLLLVFAAFALVPATWLEIWGNSRLDPGAVNVLFQLELVVAALTAAWFADETLGWRELVGGALIVGAGLIETVGHGRRGSSQVSP
jgi:drug/metabolite transporter (DMT)-like permease